MYKWFWTIFSLGAPGQWSLEFSNSQVFEIPANSNQT